MCDVKKQPIIKIERINKFLPMPKYAKIGDSGFDVMSTINHTLIPGETKLVPLGFKIELQEGFEAQIRPRSGIALKHSVTVLNSPGTLDLAYKNEVCVILINHGHDKFKINKGDRIAQVVITPVAYAELVEVNQINLENDRGGGLGSTGI